MDYASLKSLSEQMNGEQISAAGRRLVESAQLLRDATLALFLKRETVVWTGSAGDRFHKWTQSLTNSTFQLADFVHNQGTRLEFVGGTVIEAKARFPQVSQERLDQHAAMVANPVPLPGADAGAAAAAMVQSDKEIRDAQVGAAEQMRIIAQSYEGAAYTMQLEPRPEFHKPADVHDVQFFRASEDVSVGGGSGGSGSSAVSGGSSQGYGSGGRVSGGATAQVDPTAYADSGAGTVSGGHVGSVVPSGVTAVTPPLAADLAQVTPTSYAPAPVVPDTSLAVAPQTPTNVPASVVSSAPTGFVGGSTGSSGGSGIVGAGGRVQPGARVSGIGGKTTGAAPSASGGVLPRRSEGVVGGTARPGQQQPHEGRVSGGRTGMPMTGGVGGPAPSGGAAGRSVTGRPLGGVPGGVVGGAPASGRPGSRREFTTGGSGLRSRDTTSAGASGSSTGGTSHGRPGGGMHGGAAAAPPAGERGRRERADYLTEDDEYWNGRRNDGVPPVIG